jgi:GNAT superfamily N-acetyltransferase
MRTGKVFVVRERERLVATLCLTTRKPWAIDPSDFSAARRPLYLVSMAVAPDLQGQGIGRRCLEDAARIARAWPADAVRLDAYEGPAGAGEFYRRCGYTEVGRKVYRTVPLVYYELRL